MQFLKGLTRWFHFNREPEPVRSHTGECGHEIVEGRHYPPEGGLVVECKQEKLLPELSRRGFLMGLGAAAVVATLPEIPLGRVWSIPNLTVFPRNPACYDDVLRARSTWLQIDQINRRTWASVDWGYQSTALQLERIRNELPLLYDYDGSLFQRIPFDIGRSIGQKWDLVEDEKGARIRVYAEQNVRQAMGEFRKEVQDWQRQTGVYDFTDVPLLPSKLQHKRERDWIRRHTQGPATEARKIGRLVNQFGEAVANKVDREVVKPVRDGLQDVVDLINS